MIVTYIDDALIVGPTRKQCQADTTATLTLFGRLGFNIDTEKSCLQPTREITYFGVTPKLEKTFNSFKPTETRGYNSCLYFNLIPHGSDN